MFLSMVLKSGIMLSHTDMFKRIVHPKIIYSLINLYDNVSTISTKAFLMISWPCNIRKFYWSVQVIYIKMSFCVPQNQQNSAILEQREGE